MNGRRYAEASREFRISGFMDFGIPFGESESATGNKLLPVARGRSRTCWCLCCCAKPGAAAQRLSSYCSEFLRAQRIPAGQLRSGPPWRGRPAERAAGDCRGAIRRPEDRSRGAGEVGHFATGFTGRSETASGSGVNQAESIWKMLH